MFANYLIVAMFAVAIIGIALSIHYFPRKFR